MVAMLHNSSSRNDKDNTAALQTVAAASGASAAGQEARQECTLHVDTKEMREGIQKAGEKAARGMARVIERAVVEMQGDWETPEEELDRLLQADAFNEGFLRAPRVYTPDVPLLILAIYKNATKVIVTKKGIARRLGISEATLYDWIKQQRHVARAVRAGEDLQEERLASRMASGIKYPQSIFAVLKNLHHWTDKVEETHKIDFQDALAQAQQQAKRVQWDRALPSGSAPPSQVIDVSPVVPPATRPHPRTGGEAEPEGKSSMDTH